jgi:hypothetical protein
MRYLFVILIILFPAIINAQTLNKDTVKLILNDLKETWVLGVDSNSTAVDIGVYNRFKNLFDDNATIDDDLNFQYIPGKRSGVYKIVAAQKEFDMYAHDAALQLTKFRVDSWQEPVVLFERGDSMVITIQLSASADKAARYIFPNVEEMAENILSHHPDNEFEKKKEKELAGFKKERKDRLISKLNEHLDDVYKFNYSSAIRVTLVNSHDEVNTIKIKRIENISHIVTCINDEDGDGLLNQYDAKPNLFGDFTTSGTPDTDLDAVPDSTDKCTGTYGSMLNDGCPASYFTTNKVLAGALGGQFNLPNIKLPGLNQLGYTTDNGEDAMDVLQSNAGAIKTEPASAGIYAAGNYSYYFGTKAKQAGVSIGISYASFTTGIELTSPIVYTFKAFDKVDFYRRQIIIKSLKEEIAWNVLNIPVQFTYRLKLSANNTWTVNVKAGPSLMLFNNTSDYNTNIDFGGIYQIDTVSRNKITYYNFFNSGSTYNVYFTANGINGQNSNPGAAIIFAQLSNNSEGYDFAFNKNYRDKQKLSRTVVAFNLSAGGQYKRNKNNPIAVTFGFHLVYAPLPERKERYIPINKTSDEFNSLFNSTAKTAYLAYGLNLGLAYNF